MSAHAYAGRSREELNVISGIIVDAAYHIHYDLGPGLLESVYQPILARALMDKGLSVEQKKAVPLDYKGQWFDVAFEADVIIEKCIVIELKAVRVIHPVYVRQVQTYLKLLDYRLGLLLNFGAPYMRDGIIRVVNGV